MSTQLDEERFARFRLIEWWDQDKVQGAKVVVVGAGAIGNEIVKNCALLGVGRMVVIDMDKIEASNLSRSVLYRESDEGKPKAEVAARAAREIYPRMKTRAIVGNVSFDVGLGLFHWADVVLGALDNREARLAINRQCYRVGKPWVDGAIEVLAGVARVFMPPEGPCYECTMSENDWKALEQRRSCSLLNRESIEFGHVPTSPTTASIVAGIQCQEGLKLIHGLESLAGQGWVFDGFSHNSYLTKYQRNPDCLAHDPLPKIIARDRSAKTTTVREVLGWAREELGPKATLEFARDLLLALDCPDCHDQARTMRPLSALTERDGDCPHCGARRIPRLFHSVSGDEDFLDLTLDAIGLPLWDMVSGRAGERVVGFELAADKGLVLGELEDSRGGNHG